MKKKLLVFVVLFLPIVIFASDDLQTDIVPRTANFLIFVGIIYYLLADKIKFFFEDRSKSIKNKLDEVQIKLEESKKKIEFARDNFEQCKLLAGNLINDSLSEVPIIKSKIETIYENEIAILTNNLTNKMESEVKKAKQQITNEFLNELFEDNSLNITKDNLQNIILKKVA